MGISMTLIGGLVKPILSFNIVNCGAPVPWPYRTPSLTSSLGIALIRRPWRYQRVSQGFAIVPRHTFSVASYISPKMVTGAPTSP